QLTQRLTQAIAALQQKPAPADAAEPTPEKPHALAPGVTFAQGPFAAGDRKIALLFPGQGAQRIGLLREAYEQLPTFRARLDSLDDALGPELHQKLGGTLRSFLYPQVDSPEAQARLTATQVCQPAMAALGLALHGLLTDLGVDAQMTLGHSLGEFVAASAAGMLSPEECVRLVARRGLLMMGLPLMDRGAMASVAGERALVHAALAELPPLHQATGAQPVVAANLNHPTQTVISGATPGLAAARPLLEARGLKVTPLDVSHAFHSPLVAAIAQPMQELTAALALSQAKMPVISGITAALYPAELPSALPPEFEGVKQIWVRHGAAPVDFEGALKSAAQSGARVFVQVGAGTVLTGLAKATLAEGDRLLNLTLAAREDDGLAQLHAALGQLWSIGVPLDLTVLFEGRAGLVTLPASPIEQQPYWVVEAAPGASQEPIPVIAGAAVAQAAQAQQTLSTQVAQQQVAQPNGAHTGGQQPSGTRSARMDSLVELFRAQVELLKSQAQVLERQAAALSSHAGSPEQTEALALAMRAAGTQASSATLSIPPSPMSVPAPVYTAPPPVAQVAPTMPPPAQTVPAQTAPAQAAPLAASSANQKRPQAQLVAEVTKSVVAAAARISAFPAEALKTSQTLVGDLGFDSLMTVELDGDLQKAWPGVGGLPRSLLNAQTTLQHLIDHVVSMLSGDAPLVNAPPKAPLGAALGAVASAGPELKLFAPALVNVPLRAS
ncbi:MAG: acyltransferase domain-containing protein, partial [Deltaproteobacteria bacterium]|nr:acyltransferase domain-containing protein [Deltaproteobacteria bacterium]